MDEKTARDLVDIFEYQTGKTVKQIRWDKYIKFINEHLSEYPNYRCTIYIYKNGEFRIEDNSPDKFKNFNESLRVLMSEHQEEFFAFIKNKLNFKICYTPYDSSDDEWKEKMQRITNQIEEKWRESEQIENELRERRRREWEQEQKEAKKEAEKLAKEKFDKTLVGKIFKKLTGK